MTANKASKSCRLILVVGRTQTEISRPPRDVRLSPSEAVPSARPLGPLVPRGDYQETRVTGSPLRWHLSPCGVAHEGSSRSVSDPSVAAG